SKDELKLMQWILNCIEDMRDGSPEAKSIAAFTIFKVFENNKLFSLKIEDSGSTKKVAETLNVFIEKSSEMTLEQLRLDLTKGKTALDIIANYMRVISKIP